jgi:predicted NUDIX family NTP pyrophosphohydrolase
MFRHGAAGVEVFLVHPGGPLFARKDAGVWTLPKGELEPGEEALDVARREFEEETGRSAAACARDAATAFPLGSIVQRGGKTVHAFAFAGDWPDGLDVHSNEFEMEWPPRSGRLQRFPEVDRGAFFDVERAREKLNPAQVELVDRLLAILAERERG